VPENSEEQRISKVPCMDRPFGVKLEFTVVAATVKCIYEPRFKAIMVILLCPGWIIGHYTISKSRRPGKRRYLCTGCLDKDTAW